VNKRNGKGTGTKHTDLLETKLLLLDYLIYNDRISQTRCGQVMGKNAKDTIRIINEMEQEGLITVYEPTHEEEPLTRSLISITEKGRYVGQILKQMVPMCTRK